MSLSTFTPAEAACLAVVERSGFVESRHIGSAVVVGPDGTELLRLGAPHAPVFTRSSLKPLQARAALSLGAQLAGPAAALATASHRSEAGHVAVVEEMLASADLSAADLRCPSVHPADGAYRRSLAAAGDPRSPVHFNCSGKHAAFLLAARAQDADTASYLDPSHPVQQRVSEVVADFAGETPAAVGVDGCGAPVFALSLTGLARAVGRVVGPGADADSRTITDAVFADPWAIEGHGRPNTTVIDRLGVFAKGGAEGVIVMATRDGHAVALKCLDGSSRATGLVALTLLDRVGALSDIPAADVAEVAAAITDPVTGGTDSEGRTAVVGTVRVSEDAAEGARF
ncbi:asparaginase [Brevibacterium celere]|uniref:asparaginase n=1 Tax=Brevibacterium celere TaxID=225845 RepID=UPI0031D3A16B